MLRLGTVVSWRNSAVSRRLSRSARDFMRVLDRARSATHPGFRINGEDPRALTSSDDVRAALVQSELSLTRVCLLSALPARSHCPLPRSPACWNSVEIYVLWRRSNKKCRRRLKKYVYTVIDNLGGARCGLICWRCLLRGSFFSFFRISYC